VPAEGGTNPAILLAGGLATAILAIVVITVLRRRRIPQRPAGERLLAHARDRSDYRMCVGIPPAAPTRWIEVVEVEQSTVRCWTAETIPLQEITAFFVTYPRGTLVEYHCPRAIPVPDWVHVEGPSGPPDQDRLTPHDLEEGRALVRVEFGRSTREPSSRRHYSTTLTNISGERIRVLKFGGYTKHGGEFFLHTITNRFFSAMTFMEWYGQKNDWLEPGESVVDSNNYGDPPMLWAYYCETQSGRQFVAGGIIEQTR
jgi:hypothetical protein